MVRSVAVAFAMRQLRRKDAYTDEVRVQLETVWKESLEIAAICFVLAKRFTRVNPDEALLAGVLHVLGRLYIIMRGQDMETLSEADLREVVGSWHATIAKAILESCGLPASLQSAVQHQEEYSAELEGAVTLTDILIAAKLLASAKQDPDQYPALRRLGIAPGNAAPDFMQQHADEISSVRASLTD